MNDKLVTEAKGLSPQDLRDALRWHKALAEHYDENMDFNGYNRSTEKVDIIKNELRSRGEL